MSENIKTNSSLLNITETATQRLMEILKEKNLPDAIFRLFIEGFG